MLKSQTITIPASVKSDLEGFAFLVGLYDQISMLTFNDIVLDFSKCTWFEANLCAVVGAIAHNLTHNLNNVELVNLQGTIKTIFSKNLFLSHFGGETMHDKYNTTIKYKRYSSSEQTLFKKYLDEELLAKEDFPQMSDFLKKKINQSIFEVFENAVTHGQTEAVFSCGQYFPKKEPPRIDFTVVDMGVSIKRNVSEFLKRDVTGSDSILWAVDESNTTKTGDTPGGLGLKLIREFLKLNMGELQIISADGFWQQDKKNSIFAKNLKNSFPGTIVNIEVNLDDKAYYYAKEEDLTEQDIF